MYRSHNRSRASDDKERFSEAEALLILLEQTARVELMPFPVVNVWIAFFGFALRSVLAQ